MAKSISETLMSMDAETWRRHANPLSVYSRYSGLPLLALAIWSRVWIGWWALVPVVLVCLWIWLNPRSFAPPQSLDNWASKAVLGEKVWLARKSVPILPHHARLAMLLSVLNGLASLSVIYGLVVLDATATVLGTLLVIALKSWFLDRMVWLYTDMSGEHAPYADWLK